MFKTRITGLFGIEYPIIQGAMMWLSRAELISAVANAGGLGIMASSTFPTAKELRQEIKKTKSMTDKPFAVNITLLPTIRAVNYEEYINAAVEEGVGIIETAGRSPEPYMKQLREAKVKIVHKAARVRDVKTAERLGVDAVTIIGFEAAGHPSMEDVTSSVLIPRAVDEVKIPIIAGGGIGDARGFIAALALGAEGVVLGTRFMACKECPAHPKIKQHMMQVTERDTALIQRSINNQERVINTDFAQSVLEMEGKGATLEELLPLISGLQGRQAQEEGDINAGAIPCGQTIGLIHDIPSAKEIIEGIISEAKLIAERIYSISV